MTIIMTKKFSKHIKKQTRGKKKMKSNNVKGYMRKTKSGKRVRVKGHRRKNPSKKRKQGRRYALFPKHLYISLNYSRNGLEYSGFHN